MKNFAYLTLLLVSTSLSAETCWKMLNTIEDNFTSCFWKAKNGDDQAQYQVGIYYSVPNYGQDSEIVTQDFNKALTWLLKSAEQGNNQAILEVAHRFDTGKGTPVDYRQSFEWLLKAAKKEEIPAIIEVAKRYSTGKGTLQNYKRSFEWLTKGSELNDPTCQYLLGEMFLEGLGVDKNKKMAHMMFNLAAFNGHTKAATYRDIIAQKMTTFEINSAQELARNWLEKHASSQSIK